jgi:hypothetical protein
MRADSAAPSDSAELRARRVRLAVPEKQRAERIERNEDTRNDSKSNIRVNDTKTSIAQEARRLRALL